MKRLDLVLGRCRHSVLPAVFAATVLVIAMPATAEDNQPAPPGIPGGCGGPIGGQLPPGSVVVVRPGDPSPPGTFGNPGMYVCVDGHWIWIGFGGTVIGPGGPIFMEGAPTLTVGSAGVSVAEGLTASNSGTFSYAGDAPVTLAASVGNVTGHGDGTWSWSYAATDGPAQSQSVLITATAEGKVGAATFELTVDNVAPTVVSVTADSATALVGQPVTFLGTATDASPEDTLAGFSWTFDGATTSGNAFTTSFAQCGPGTVTATATDKDGGTSDVATSAAVAVAAAQFVAPLRAGSYNLVQSGQVVPVRVKVGCDGVSVDGLSPLIQVLSGDVDSATDADDPAQSVATTDASGADTSKVMRAADGAYLYNLRVPTASANTLFTVRVRPFDGRAAVYVVLKIRK